LKTKLPVAITGLELNKIIFVARAVASVGPCAVVVLQIAVFSPAIIDRL